MVYRFFSARTLTFGNSPSNFGENDYIVSYQEDNQNLIDTLQKYLGDTAIQNIGSRIIHREPPNWKDDSPDYLGKLPHIARALVQKKDLHFNLSADELELLSNYLDNPKNSGKFTEDDQPKLKAILITAFRERAKKQNNRHNDDIILYEDKQVSVKLAKECGIQAHLVTPTQDWENQISNKNDAPKKPASILLSTIINSNANPDITYAFFDFDQTLCSEHTGGRRVDLTQKKLPYKNGFLNFLGKENIIASYSSVPNFIAEVTIKHWGTVKTVVHGTQTSHSGQPVIRKGLFSRIEAFQPQNANDYSETNYIGKLAHIAHHLLKRNDLEFELDDTHKALLERISRQHYDEGGNEDSLSNAEQTQLKAALMDAFNAREQKRRSNGLNGNQDIILYDDGAENVKLSLACGMRALWIDANSKEEFKERAPIPRLLAVKTQENTPNNIEHSFVFDDFNPTAYFNEVRAKLPKVNATLSAIIPPITQPVMQDPIPSNEVPAIVRPFAPPETALTPPPVEPMEHNSESQIPNRPISITPPEKAHEEELTPEPELVKPDETNNEAEALIPQLELANPDETNNEEEPLVPEQKASKSTAKKAGIASLIWGIIEKIGALFLNLFRKIAQFFSGAPKEPQKAPHMPSKKTKEPLVPRSYMPSITTHSTQETQPLLSEYDVQDATEDPNRHKPSNHPRRP